MGTSQVEQFSPTMLQPAQQPQDARLQAVRFGASLSISAGQAMALKASDNLCYPLFGTAGSNEVQTVAVDTIVSGGSISITAVDSNGKPQTAKVAYNTTWTQTVADIQTALNALLGASAVAAAVVATHDMTLTFSGTNYAAINQPPVGVDISAATGPTKVTVTETTAGGTSDGTQLFKGWSQYTLQTDANGNVYLMSNGTAAGSLRMTSQSTASIFTNGIFDPQDLTTRSTPVAEVDTFTPTNPTTGDVYTITITRPDLTTYAVSATVGATQTATAIVALLKAAWNADTVAAAYATATGSTTLVLTSAIAGNTMNLAGTVVGTGTIAKVLTTTASGRAIADILPGAPGARVLVNGFWYLP